MYIVNNLSSSQLLLSKINILVLKKILREELAKDSSRTSTTPKKLDIKVHSLINAINMAIILAIHKAKLSLNLV